MHIEEVPIRSLQFHDDIVARDQVVNPAAVDDYAKAYERGEELPPPRAYQIGASRYITRGRHRVAAALKAKVKKIKVEIVEGTLDEAKWDAAAGNTDQKGLRRTLADRRQAVRLAIQAFPDRCDSVVARHVEVDDTTVKKIREKMEEEGKIEVKEERIDGRGHVHKRPKQESSGIPFDSSDWPKSEQPQDYASDNQEEPVEVPTDAVGNPIPNGVADIMLDPRVGKFLDLLKALHLAANQVEQDMEALRKLENRLPYVQWGELAKKLPKITDWIAESTHLVNQGIPYAVCEHCGGDSCYQCHHAGYVPKWMYDNQPSYEEK